MPHPEPLDTELDLTASDAEQLAVERVRAGDALALEMIFSAFRRELLLLAEQVAGSPEVGEEVIQEVFLAIWRGRARWRVTISLRAYLRRAVRNVASRARTSRSRGGSIGMSLDGGDRIATTVVPDPAPTPAEDAAYDELASALHAATSTMPPRARDVFRMRRELGMSNREIAGRLGVSLKTVETHMARALKILRRRLRDWLDDP